MHTPSDNKWYVNIVTLAHIKYKRRGNVLHVVNARPNAMNDHRSPYDTLDKSGICCWWCISLHRITVSPASHHVELHESHTMKAERCAVCAYRVSVRIGGGEMITDADNWKSRSFAIHGLWMKCYSNDVIAAETAPIQLEFRMNVRNTIKIHRKWLCAARTYTRKRFHRLKQAAIVSLLLLLLLCLFSYLMSSMLAAVRRICFWVALFTRTLLHFSMQWNDEQVTRVRFYALNDCIEAIRIFSVRM